MKGVSDITGLYFKKHGVQLAGKRIFIRARQAVDGGARLYEEVKELVSEPKGREGGQKRPNPFETPS